MRLILEEYPFPLITGNQLGDIQRVERGWTDSLVVRMRRDLSADQIADALALAVARVIVSTSDQVLGRAEGPPFPPAPHLICQTGRIESRNGDRLAPTKDVERKVASFPESFFDELRKVAKAFKEGRTVKRGVQREIDLTGPAVRPVVDVAERVDTVDLVRDAGEDKEQPGRAVQPGTGGTKKPTSTVRKVK